MASEESFLVLVHYRGSIKRKTRSGVKFTDKDPLCIIVTPTTTYDALVSSVLEKLGLEGVKRVKKFFYRIPTAVLHDTVKFDCFTIGSDEDLQVMFLSRRQFDDPDDDDVEPDMIADESGDDVGTTVPTRGTGGSSFGTQQYPPHFSSLDLDAMRQDENALQPSGFGARETEGSAGMNEFQVGQQFQDKDEALLSVKTYSIRRGVQYKVVKSDYRRYVGKCSEFGNGCTWLIRLSLRQRKGIWEVKRYNGPHTCLASSISSDHRSLDYHVISTFIMPMVRADAAVNIKVLQNATAAHFGFRPTYRRIWMAKQKAVAVIYGDWDESYNELPRWVLGVQLTMPGTVAVLRTCPVRVGGQVDESQVYFHRLFWTFPPCIQAFRHCKPLVSIDGTHLYGKYGGTLLVAKT
ncbi:uncharacterized protein LOC130965668 [Arachis stenosperma]|uniref:uncharacterized protein LOC130965668 n=1 Tax=Arachis stenosperma TaxID=217475 RepID=UPI0025ACC3C5|nr:uncharacterized protein LOC130965668 [Arachis stenosperma]